MLAAVAAVSVAGAVRGATPEVIYDLRLAGTSYGGGKSASVSTASTAVNLELFALVKDLDLTASNTGFNSAQGLWTSSSGGLLGNLSTSLTSPFNNISGSQNPSPVDRDGDGDLDVGNLASASSGFWIPSAGTNQTFTNVGSQTIGADTYRVFKLGTGTFTASNFNLAGTSISFVPRIGDGLVKPQKYFKDSTSSLTSINGNDSRLSVNAGVVISAASVAYTWSGAVSSSWGTTSNWSTAGGIPSSVLDTATFGNTGAGSVNLGGNRTVGALTFTNSSATAYQFVGSGSDVLTVANSSGVGTIMQNGSTTVTFSGSVSLSATTLNVTGTGSGNTRINGPVIASTLTKSGTGSLTLAGSSGSTIGAITLNGGSLRVETTNAIAGAAITLAGGTLDLRRDTATSFTANVDVTANSTITADRVSSGGSNLLSLANLAIGDSTLTIGGGNGDNVGFSGAITLSGLPTFATNVSGSGLNLTGTVGGPGGFIKTGNGAMSLEGPTSNSYTGATIVNGGSLVLNKQGGVNAVGGNVTVNSGGTLYWFDDEQIPDTATLTLNSGGTINLNNRTETVDTFVDLGGTIVLGSGKLNVIGGDVILSDNSTISTGLNVPRGIRYTGSTTGAAITGAVTLTNQATTHEIFVQNGGDTPDLVISGAIAGSTGILKTGAGHLRFSAAAGNSYTGTTEVQAGTLTLDGMDVNPLVAGPLVISGGSVIANSSNAIDDSSSISIASGASLQFNNTDDTVGTITGAGTLLLGSSEIITGNDNGSGIFSGAISGNGEFSYIGQGVLKLSGNNNFLSSAITVANGTLAFGAAQNVGSGQLAIGNGGTLRADATVDLSNAVVVTGTSGGSIDVVTGSTLTVHSLARSAGVGTLVKAGAGTLEFSNATAYDGDISVSAGTLLFHNGALSGSPNVTLSSGALLDTSATGGLVSIGSFAGGGDVVLGNHTFSVGNSSSASTVYSGQISGDGTFEKNGTGSITLTGSSAVASQLHVFNGGVTVTGAGAFAAQSGIVVGSSTNAVLTIGGGGSVSGSTADVYGSSAGVGTVNVNGGGTLNVVAGMDVGNAIGAGTLTIDSGGAVHVGGAFSVFANAGTIVNLSGGALKVGSLSTGSPDHFNWSAGSLEIAAGDMNFGSGGALGSNYTIGAGKSLVVSGASPTLRVGQGAAAALTISGGGSVSVTNAARFGSSGGVAGDVTIGLGSSLGVGGTLSVGDAGSSTTQVQSGGTIHAGQLQVAPGATSTGTLSIASGAAVTVDNDLAIGGTMAVPAGAGQVTVSGALDVGGTIKVWNTASTGLTVSGAVTTGSMNLIGISQVLAGGTLTTTTGGLVLANNSSPLLVLDSDATNPGTLSLNGGVSFTGSAGSAAILSGGVGAEPGVIDLNGLTQTFSVGNGSMATDLSITARITNGGISKSGAGLLQLGAANKYTGPTALTTGTIQANVADAIPAASAVTISGNAALDLNGFNDTIGSLTDLGAGNTGTVNLGAGRLTTGGDNMSTSFHGGIGGTTGGITKEGTGTLTLAGPLVFSGALNVDGGTLRLLNSNPGLTGSVTVSGNGPAYGTLSMPADNLGSASLTMAGGHLATEASFSIGRNIKLDLGGGFFDVQSGHTLALNGVLNDVGLLTKDGPGTLVLGNVNTYTGQTFIAAGTVQTAVAGALPSSSAVNMNPSTTLQLLGGANQTIASLSGSGSIDLGTALLSSGVNDATTQYAGAIGGAGGLVKEGTGTLTLGGNLTFGGGAVVNAGTLELNGSGTFLGNVTVNSSATVSIAGAGNVGAAANVVHLNGGTFRVAAGAGSVTSPNPVTITAAGTIDVQSGATLVQSGAFTGSGAFRKSGGGTMRLDSPTPFAGSATIDGGTLRLVANATASQVTSFHLTAGGTLELDNDNDGNSNNNFDRILDSAAVTLAGGTVKLIGASGVASSEFAGGLTLGPGASNVVLQQNGVGGSTVLRFASLDAVDPGASLDLSAASGAGTTNRLLITGQPAGFIGGWATVEDRDFAEYHPTQGWIALTGQSPTFAQGANVKLTASSDPQTNVTDINTLTIDTDTAASGVNVNLNAGTFTVTGGGILKSGTNASSIAGGRLTSGTGRLDVRSSGNGVLTIGSAITGNINLVKSGSGVLELTSTDAANHDFNGDVYLNRGTLRISDDANLGANLGNDNGVVFNGGTLQTTGGNAMSFSSGRVLTVDAGGGTLDIQNPSITIGTSNQLAGSGPLTLAGSGDLIVTAANPYSGALQVGGGGTLALRHVDALGAPGNKSTIILSPGSQLDLRSNSNPANFGNNIVVLDNTGDSNSALITTGRLSGSANGPFRLGTLRIGAATLQSSGSTGFLEFNGIVTLSGTTATVATFETLNADLTKGMKLSERVTGGGSLRKAGDGMLTLGSGSADDKPNTYSGNTIIAGGVLRLDKKSGTNAIPGNIIMSGGTLELMRSHQIAASSTVSIGGGTFNLSVDQAVKTIDRTGGAVNVTGSKVTVGTSIWGGSNGSTAIGAEVVESPPVGGWPPGFEPAGATPVTSVYDTDILTVTDGTNVVNAGGSLNIGSGGLFFTGSANPTISLASHSTTPGMLKLSGDVTNYCDTGTAQILSSGTAATAGTISLEAGVRSFIVPSTTSDLKITARLTNGGIRKSGTGKLILMTRGDLPLGTTISGGTIEAHDFALGTQPISISSSSGALQLRSNSSTVALLNDLTTVSSMIDVDRESGVVATPLFKLGRLSIGGNRLIVTGANGSLEFTGDISLTGSSSSTTTFDNSAPVTLSGAISGSAKLTKDTRAGVLRFSGSSANTYSGVTTVSAGTLELAKTARTNAIAGNLAVSSTGTVKWLADDQVADAANVSMNGSSALVDFDGFSDTIGSINMTGGTIDTAGATFTGTIRLTGDVTTAFSTNIATISGKLDLGATMHNFTIADHVSSPVDDLIVSADVSGAGGGITKQGDGTLVLSGNNTFTGGVNVLAGTLKTSGATNITGAQAISVSAGTLDMPGALTTAAGVVVTKTGAGALSISGAQTHGANTQLALQGGALSMNTDAGSSSTRTLAINASSGSVSFTASQHLASLTAGTGVNVTLSPTGNKVIYTNSLSLSGTAKLNLGTGTLIVKDGTLGTWDGSNYTGIRGMVTAGSNGGAWNGNGIITTQSNAAASKMLTTLAVASASELGVTTFNGQSVDSTAILVRYTFLGDTDLDTDIDGDDYFRLDNNIAQSGKVFGTFNGDIDSNGRIDADDYFLLDRNYSRQIQQPLESLPVGIAAGSTAGGMTAVPEPSSMALLIGAGALLARRRRRDNV